jgi:hypothetical protein
VIGGGGGGGGAAIFAILSDHSLPNFSLSHAF